MRPRTHCKSGRHEWTPENTHVYADGFRRCLLCRHYPASEAEGGALEPSPPRVSLANIQQRVAADFGVRASDILSQMRGRWVARPRQVAMYIARDLTSLSYPAIGRLFKRDHTTVMHAVGQVERLRASDAALAARIERLERELGA